MPGLVVFNRRWMVAGDELVIPFGLAFIVRSLWFIAVAVIFGIQHFEKHDQSSGCNKDIIDFYFIAYLILLVFSTINDGSIAVVSSRGSIFEKKSRKNLPIYLYIRFSLLVLEAISGILGCYYVYSKEKDCFSSYNNVLSQVVSIFNVLWVFGCLFAMWLTFDTAGNIWYVLLMKKDNKSLKKYRSVDTLEFERKITEKNEKYWSRTCKLLFCCTKTENSRDNVLLFVAKLLANYFRNFHDLVPTDILAGMILLRQKQKFEEYKRVKIELERSNSSFQQITYKNGKKIVRRHQKTINSVPFDPNSQEDLDKLDEVTYFAKYALACYGWPMYCFLNNVPICKKEGCKLMGRVRCCFCCCGRKCYDAPDVKGDNCCLCNLAAQKVILDINDDNFIYVSYEDEVFKTPFSVIVDKPTKSIVVSCRGTLSMQDVLTDLSIAEKQLPAYEEGWTAHEGFLEAATDIKKIIDEKKLIERARDFDVENGSRDYKIVLVGHSLGAGTATVLAFLMKPQYPDLICFAYGPPGTSVSLGPSKHARDFIYSVVLGKDIIGRMNLHTMNELMYNIMEMLKKTKMPKWKILRGCVCQCVLCCTKSIEHSFHDYFDCEEDLYFEPYQNDNIRKLYMAGKVVHICKIKSIYPRFFGEKTAVYKGYWSTPEDFQSILISNLMLRDHYPDALIDALSSLLPDEGVEREITSTTLINDGSTDKKHGYSSPTLTVPSVLAMPTEESPLVSKVITEFNSLKT